MTNFSKTPSSVFDSIEWRDHISHKSLIPMVKAWTPASLPICDVNRSEGTDSWYSIENCEFENAGNVRALRLDCSGAAVLKPDGMH